MEIKAFFDRVTFTLTYVVYDEATRDAVIIDPVLDFDPASGKLTTTSVDEVINFVRGAGLKAHRILETHAHADHLSASQTLKGAFPGARLAIGSGIRQVQATFKALYALPADFPVDGSQFDELIEAGQELAAGSLRCRALATPGHTPSCLTFDFAGHLFVGDVLFMPDYGVGRTDFPGGSAASLYDSIMQLYRLPETNKVFTGHDYLPGGRALRYEASIGEHKASNVQLKAGTGRDEFIRFRTERDATLSAPRLLHPSVQVNIAGGRMPPPEANGTSFVRIPLSGALPGR